MLFYLSFVHLFSLSIVYNVFFFFFSEESPSVIINANSSGSAALKVRSLPYIICLCCVSECVMSNEHMVLRKHMEQKQEVKGLILF